MSCLARRPVPAANAVRARNDGAKPSVTSAKAPFFRNTRLEVMGPARSALLKLWRSQRERDALSGIVGFRDGGARRVGKVVRKRGFDRGFPALDACRRIVDEPASLRLPCPALRAYRSVLSAGTVAGRRRRHPPRGEVQREVH